MAAFDQATLPAILATEAEAARRLRLGFGFGKLGCLFGTAFALFFVAIGHYWGALVVTLCTAGFAGNILVLRRGRLALAGNIYALLLTTGFAVLTAIEGGLAGHSIAWLSVVPLCACLFAGPRAGERWCVACLGAVCLFGLFSCLGYRMPMLYPSERTTFVSAVGYIALTVFMTTLGIIFETSRQRTFQELRITLDELADKNRALFHSMDELSRSEARFRMLFESSALGVALLNGEGEVEIANSRLAALLGVPAARDFSLAALVRESERPRFLAELQRQQRLQIPHPAGDKSFLAANSLAGNGEEPGGEEFTLELPGRRRRLFRMFLNCVHSSSGQVCAVLDDITRQRALERGAAQQEKSALLDTLIGGIAHELNNKLTPVAGFAELMLAQAARGELPPHLAEPCLIISNGAAEAGKIISQLLQLSRPLAVDMQVCDLRQIIESVCAVLIFRLRETGSQLKLDLPAQPVLVNAEPAQIKQVVLNLAFNALHAMDLPGVAERRLCLRVQEAAGGAVSLSVADTGCGMDARVRERIFDPFFTTKGNGGTGLGLSVCASIIKSHGGTIEVESQPGVGSTFRVRLPLSLEVADATPGYPFTDVLLPENAVPRNACALVVDDEENIGELVQEMLLAHLGCESVHVSSVEAAIERLGQGLRCDFVVSDLRLPGLNGLDFWESLRQVRPDLARRFIIITGDAGSPELCEELNRAQVPVLQKPFTFGELVGAVERVWRQTPLRAVATAALPGAGLLRSSGSPAGLLEG